MPHLEECPTQTLVRQETRIVLLEQKRCSVPPKCRVKASAPQVFSRMQPHVLDQDQPLLARTALQLERWELCCNPIHFPPVQDVAFGPWCLNLRCALVPRLLFHGPCVAFRTPNMPTPHLVNSHNHIDPKDPLMCTVCHPLDPNALLAEHHRPANTQANQPRERVPVILLPTQALRPRCHHGCPLQLSPPSLAPHTSTSSCASAQGLAVGG
mmetsp:Transcript_46802/g.93177  ORF Transcript_46802/g.93177 Transcript_46802/m.93177 type:complete len:211 (-) Transcript_46802:722-1354(-)